MARLEKKNLFAAVLLSTVLLFAGCRNTDHPVSQQTVPAARPATPGSPEETLPSAPTVSSPTGTVPGPQVPDETEEATTPTRSDDTVFADEALAFPVHLSEDRLILEAPFSYDGLNPDFGNAEGRNIAAVTLKNSSQRHLVLAELTLVATDGTEISFVIEHLPAGKQVTAFALDNSRLPDDDQWSEVLVSAQFAESESLLGQGLSVQANGTLLSLSNDTGKDLTNLMIYCHNLLGEEYFGGKAYPYEVNNIPAGGTAEVDALDCILGIAEASYAAGNQE